MKYYVVFFMASCLITSNTYAFWSKLQNLLPVAQALFSSPPAIEQPMSSPSPQEMPSAPLPEQVPQQPVVVNPSIGSSINITNCVVQIHNHTNNYALPEPSKPEPLLPQLQQLLWNKKIIVPSSATLLAGSLILSWVALLCRLRSLRSRLCKESAWSLWNKDLSLACIKLISAAQAAGRIMEEAAERYEEPVFFDQLWHDLQRELVQLRAYAWWARLCNIVLKVERLTVNPARDIASWFVGSKKAKEAIRAFFARLSVTTLLGYDESLGLACPERIDRIETMRSKIIDFLRSAAQQDGSDGFCWQ